MATQHNFRIKNGLEVAGTVRITSAGLITGTTTTQAASDNTTKLASTAYVTTALANLSDSAPSTLNTLNELAAALGDDANYATTTTNAIAAKAPLANPTLTGSLTVEPTAATGLSYAVDGTNSYINFEANSVAASVQLYAGQSSGGYFSIGTKNSSGTLAEKMRITPTGKVGIGTTTPSQLLTVEGSSFPILQISNTDANNPANAVALDLVEKQTGYAAATATFGQTGVYGYRLKLDGSSNDLILQSGVQTAVTDRITIERDTGNVGIGVTPDNILHVKTTASGGPQIHLDTGTGSAFMNFDGTNLQLSTQRDMVDGTWHDTSRSWGGININGTTSGSTITFTTAGNNNTSPTTRMTIDTSGRVGIGTTTPGNNHAKANNLVVGSGSAGGMAVFNGTAEGWYAFSRANANNTDAYDGGMSYTDRILRFHTNAGATRLKIDASGDTEIYGHLGFEDNKLLMFGGGQDARLYFDASTNALMITASNGTANTVNITTNNFQIGGATPLISGTANDSVVINQDGASNVDFRVESDNEAHNFFCDASSEIIHFGEGTNSDAQQVIPAGTLAGRRHAYHGGNRTHAGQTFKYCEGTSWADAIKIDWNNASWGGVCMRITGMYDYNASNNFSIVIGFAGHAAYGSVSYDATSSGALNWTNALQLAQPATGETMIRQRAGDNTGDVVYRYEWQTYNRSDQTILIIEQ